MCLVLIVVIKYHQHQSYDLWILWKYSSGTYRTTYNSAAAQSWDKQNNRMTSNLQMIEQTSASICLKNNIMDKTTMEPGMWMGVSEISALAEQSRTKLGYSCRCSKFISQL